MYTILKKTIWVLGLIFVCSFTYASDVFRVNAANIPVADKSKQVLAEVLPQALEQVLVKMSGDNKVTTVPALRKVLPHARRYMIGYSYLNRLDANNNPTLYVQVIFNRRAIETLLRNAKQSIWSDNRPQTLIWLHVQKDSMNYFLSGNDHGEIAIDIKNRVFGRGIPYQVPLMDMQDQASLNPADPNSFTPDRLQTLATRYQSQAVLAGNVIMDKNQQWQGAWHLLLNGKMIDWNSSNSDIHAMIATAIDRVADVMTGRNVPVLVNAETTSNPSHPQNTSPSANESLAKSVPASNNNSISAQAVHLAVSGVNGLDDYARLVKYLQDLSPVAEVSVRDMEDTMVLLDVNVSGGADKFVQALQNSKLLKIVDPGTASARTPSVKADFYAEWLDPSPVVSTHTAGSEIVQPDSAQDQETSDASGPTGAAPLATSNSDDGISPAQIVGR